MCFGNSTQQQSTTTNSSYTPAPYLTAAAQQNLGFAQNIQNQGFTPYTGQQVANFSPQQQASFGQGSGIAGAVTPDLQLAGGALQNYTTAGAQHVTPQTIASNMTPYMNQYVNLALQPQLAAAANSYMLQSQANQGAATSAGAFGDPRANILQSNLGLNFGLQNQGLVGNAYNAAFNTAIGAGAQDVANNLNAQTTNANLAETALGRNLTGANAILGANTGSATLQNQFGNQQTAQQQAQLNAMYNQYLMAMQYPFQTTGLVNQTIGAAVPASPSKGTSNSVTTVPDNSGFGILGSLIGAGGSYLSNPAIFMSDEKLKKDIEPVAKLHDGTNVVQFRFKGEHKDAPKRTGFVAQDVEKHNPAAVTKIGKYKAVNYPKVINDAANSSLAAQLGAAA